MASEVPSSSDDRLALDDLDRDIIAALRADGRVSNRKLARELGVNEATVSSRIRRLSDESVIRVTAVTDMTALGYDQLVIAFIGVAGRSVTEVADELARIPEAMSVGVVFGEHDLAVTLLARDLAHVGELLDGSVGPVNGVARVDCELCLDVRRFRSEYAVFT